MFRAELPKALQVEVIEGLRRGRPDSKSDADEDEYQQAQNGGSAAPQKKFGNRIDANAALPRKPPPAPIFARNWSIFGERLDRAIPAMRRRSGVNGSLTVIAAKCGGSALRAGVFMSSTGVVHAGNE